MDIDDKILGPFQKLCDADITHDELGTANGFHDSQTIKSKACDHIQRIINLVNSFGHHIEDGYLNDNLIKVKNYTAQLWDNVGTINSLVDGGSNQVNYPKQRTNLQNQIRL